MGSAILSLYRLMYPLSAVDLSTFDPNSFVRPLWKQGEKMYLRVYLSTSPRISADYFKAGYESEESEDDETSSEGQGVRTKGIGDGPVALLWDETVNSPAFSKSFLLTTCQDDDSACKEGTSHKFASSWLDHAEHAAAERGEGGVLSVVSAAGHGIESTSILLTFYQSVYSRIRSLLANLHLVSIPEKESQSDLGILERKIVNLSPTSPIWSQLQHNATLYLHVLVLRGQAVPLQSWPPLTAADAHKAVTTASRSNALLGGQVDLVKFDVPHHASKPSRILYHDLAYIIKRFFLRGTTTDDSPPWDMEYSNPEEYRTFQQLKRQQQLGQGYPYWKPEVSVKYVTDVVDYPLDHVGRSGMPLVRTQQTAQHPTGYSYTPAIHVDEIGLTSEKYIPINGTVTSLPLRISFDRSDMEHKNAAMTGTAGGISPARWRLLSHLSQALESQKAMGFDESDIDDLRRLIADTNVTLLMITLLASALHLLFEFLTFKNEVSFWRNNEDLTGLSVRSLFLDMIGQTIILLYLIEQDSSLLITIPSAVGCLIALWKCHRAAGLKLERVSNQQVQQQQHQGWWNVVPRLFGYTIRATRLELKTNNGSKDEATSAKDRLALLTMESDRTATRTLGVFLLPLVLGYTLYQWIYVPHIGWFSSRFVCDYHAFDLLCTFVGMSTTAAVAAAAAKKRR